MNPYSTNWAEVKTLLHAARHELLVDAPTRKSVPVGTLQGTLDEFEEFLDHNELELAWDALAAFAERNDAPSTCWRRLAQAAGIMELTSKQEAAEARALIRSR